MMEDLVQVEIEDRDAGRHCRCPAQRRARHRRRGQIGSLIAEAMRFARGVVVDMSDLAFIDSSGASMLFALARRVGSRRQELRVVAPAGKPGLAYCSRGLRKGRAGATRTWTPR